MAEGSKFGMMRKNRSLEKEEEFSVSEGGSRRPKRLSTQILIHVLMRWQILSSSRLEKGWISNQQDHYHRQSLGAFKVLM